MLVMSMHDEVLYSIIKYNNHVRIPGRNPLELSNYVKDQPENEWEILDRDGVNIHPNETFVIEAQRSPARRLEHPSDIFLFDDCLEKETVDNSHGTLTLYGNNLNSKYLTRHFSIRFSENEETSWKIALSNFHKGKMPPSNALVIIDRYLFQYQPTADGRGVDYNNGIRNIYGILNELLPETFEGDYQILIVFDSNQISQPAGIKDVVRGMQSLRQTIRKGKYFPTIELLPIRREADKEFYRFTHDRMIISNYYSIRATHGFSAVLPCENRRNDQMYTGSGKGTWSQMLDFNVIYAGIEKDEDDRDLSSLPVIFNDEILASLRTYYKTKAASQEAVDYICNGNSHCHISQLKNRLVVK